MTGPAVRLRDFGLESQARLTQAATYGEAEMEAMRRRAFAEGEAAGRAAAAAAAETVQADHLAALEDVLRNAAAMRAEAETLVATALDQLESLARAAILTVAPGLAQAGAAAACGEALQAAAAVVRLPGLRVRVAPDTLGALQTRVPPLPEGLCLEADSTLPPGAARLDWPRGGADFAPDAALSALHQSLSATLGEPPPLATPAANGNPDPLYRSETDD